MNSITTLLNKRGLVQILSGLAFSMVAISAHAQVTKDLDALGDKKAEARASQLDSRARVGIVQGRTVDRNWRVELGANYGGVAAGDSYLNTSNLGVSADLHINPKFSLGVHYSKAYNSLTSEGQDRFNQGSGTNYSIPQISYPEQTIMGVLDWYMLYGKMNFFDIKTIQFDIYSLIGAGQVQTSTSYANSSSEAWSNTYTAGGGIGFWITQHFTTRLELRYQRYTDQVYTGSRDLNLIVGSLGFGVLL